MTDNRDVKQVVKYLTTTFNNAMNMASLERPVRTPSDGPNQAYTLTTEFAYLLNEITQGPRCMQQKYITDCNDLINQVLSMQPK